MGRSCEHQPSFLDLTCTVAYGGARLLVSAAAIVADNSQVNWSHYNAHRCECESVNLSVM